jgi:hypothetical protein
LIPHCDINNLTSRATFIDIAKKDLVTAKWRVVVVEPCAITSSEIGTAENPDKSDRPLHFLYGEIGTGAADLSNVLVGSVAMNAGVMIRNCDQIRKCDQFANVLQLKCNGSKGLLPVYIEMFSCTYSQLV